MSLHFIPSSEFLSRGFVEDSITGIFCFKTPNGALATFKDFYVNNAGFLSDDIIKKDHEGWYHRAFEFGIDGKEEKIYSVLVFQDRGTGQLEIEINDAKYKRKYYPLSQETAISIFLRKIDKMMKV
jgi:hypothetical protein